ncbi:MAG: Coenzyme F420 hydrogenase/dehydrogenase, beta subunit C-terminal domain [Oscillospiraceae bacterium]|jgi:coenzyme F420-reducing hydrogenase beta subunit|nr:Coenzyme F420 hydrogenase/dehydrogenase, beta subunit C-terminal domain [Oscillospiraceae bacterium]
MMAAVIVIKILLFGQFDGERAQVARYFGRAELLDYDAPLTPFVTSRFRAMTAEADVAIHCGEPKYKPYVSAAKKAGCKLALWGCETAWVKRCHTVLPLFDLIFALDREAYAALRGDGYTDVVLPKPGGNEPDGPEPSGSPEPEQPEQSEKQEGLGEPEEPQKSEEPEKLEEPETPKELERPEETEKQEGPEQNAEPIPEPDAAPHSPPMIDLSSLPKLEPLPELERLPERGRDMSKLLTPRTHAYGVVNPNENVRAASSAGGVFTLLCEEIIGQGGVVFGARYNEKFETVHVKAERMPECVPMRGVKYAAGETEGIYEQAVSCLRQGKRVLFTGTACQIARLYAHPGGRPDHPRLLTADMVCGGIADPAVFAQYLTYVEEKNGAPATAVDMSGKPMGLGRASARVGSENGTYEVPVTRDPFLRAYRAGLCLLPECHRCSHLGERRGSDLTLGGFPDGRRHIPELYDDKGASLVLAHTQKGRDMMEALVRRAIVREVPPDALPSYNAALVSIPGKHKNRDRFYEDVGKMPFDKAVARSIGPAGWSILTAKRSILPVWRNITRLVKKR